MSVRTLVWAYRRLPELANQLGFVECDQGVADFLIEQGKAQDPRVGGMHLREMERAPVTDVTPPLEDERRSTEYKTTNLDPPAAKRRK